MNLARPDENIRAAFLGMGAVLILALGLAAWALVGSHDAAIRHRNETAAAIRTLCARQHTQVDVLRAGIAIVTAERMDPGVPDATHRADDVFIRLFNKDLQVVLADFRNPDSACYKVKR